MRANSTGPPCSAAFVRSSAAIRTSGEPRSAAVMVLTRSAIALRRDAAWHHRPARSARQNAGTRTTQLRNRTGIQTGRGRFVPEKSAEPFGHVPALFGPRGLRLGVRFFDRKYLWTARNTASINQRNVVA
jgi:hypothetical protein